MVTVFHWNYEFEQYPQPANREFSFHLIDMGVGAVIGHHSHIIQGYEYYKGKPIFYGLGNCYFPNDTYEGFNFFPPKNEDFIICESLTQDFCSSSRRRNRRIASYATVYTTQKTDKKTSQDSDIIKFSLPIDNFGLSVDIDRDGCEMIRPFLSDFKGALKSNTGGTSGTPFAFYLDKDAFAREWAHMHKVWALKGYSFRDIKLTFRGRNLGDRGVVYNPVHNEFIVNTSAS